MIDLDEFDGPEGLIGHYVIVNDFDQPCDRLIARVLSVEPIGHEQTVIGAGPTRWTAHCAYCNLTIGEGDRKRKRPVSCPLEGMTLVEDFARKVCGRWPGPVTTQKIGDPSSATYRDGSPRVWQPEF